MGRKLGGGSAPFVGEEGLGLHLHKVFWADANIHTKWHFDACSCLATMEMGRKLGRGLRRLLEEGTGSPSNTKSPGLRPTSMPGCRPCPCKSFTVLRRVRNCQCYYYYYYYYAGYQLHPSSCLAAINMGQKFGEGLRPPFARRAGSPSNTKSPGLRPTSIPSDILIHAAIWRQQLWAKNWGVCPFTGG